MPEVPIGIKPTVDYAFKRIFGNPDDSRALISLLNSMLALPRPIQSLVILNPFSRQEYEKDKTIVLDIKARDDRGRLLNVEMQSLQTLGLERRLAYYACRMFVDQLPAGKDYKLLSPATHRLHFERCPLRGYRRGAS